MYENVYYAQEHQAEELISLLKEEGPQVVLNYLSDCHDEGRHEVFVGRPWGKDDEVYRSGSYILTYNFRLPMIGLHYQKGKR